MKCLHIPIIFTSLVSLALFISCSKDDKPPLTDCQKNNYGILKVTYGSNSVRHRTMVFIGFGFVEKVAGVGILQDTFHIPPGYVSVHISSINSVGASIDSREVPVNIVQCEEVHQTVTF